MNTKYIHYIHFTPPFLVPFPLLLDPTPGKDLFYPPALHFLKAYIDSQRDFTLAWSTVLMAE
jgi:hypothetical protein